MTVREHTTCSAHFPRKQPFAVVAPVDLFGNEPPEPPDQEVAEEAEHEAHSTILALGSRNHENWCCVPLQ